MLQPLMVTLTSLKESMQKSKTGDSNKDLTSRDVKMMLVLPYFLGPKLFDAAPTMKMLDYKVTYERHRRLTSAGTSDNSGSNRRVSIVRLFTDLPPRDIRPPSDLESQFRFCEDCQRYSSVENPHCDLCKACTTLHGRPYVHCNACSRCRPPDRVHCYTCGWCVQNSAEHNHHSEPSRESRKRKIFQ
ncbi:hypothetical protein AAHC03_01313 [Spirometra sp. Aus1]